MPQSSLYGKSVYAPGSLIWTTPGTYNFTVPAGVNTVHAQVYGGGGGGAIRADLQDSAPAGGGGSGYINNTTFSVVPGSNLTIIVGAGGSAGQPSVGGSAQSGGVGGNSYVSYSGSNYLAYGGNGGSGSTQAWWSEGRPSVPGGVGLYSGAGTWAGQYTGGSGGGSGGAPHLAAPINNGGLGLNNFVGGLGTSVWSSQYLYYYGHGGGGGALGSGNEIHGGLGGGGAYSGGTGGAGGAGGVSLSW